MSGRIPKNFIDDLLARVDIVDVIDAHVKLTRGGRDYKACCPFHNEKSPSFTVSQEKQFYHCFGCGAHGTAVGFLMEYAGLDFPDAIEQLAERVGIEVPREGGAPREDYTALREVLERTSEWYGAQLRNHPGRAAAVEYLKGRGLTGEVAARYQIGFAPPGRANLQQALGTGDGARALLVQAGLVVERAPGQFLDRFRNRVTFPIHDRRGHVVGFGGRVLDDGQPKYLNSPETPLFHKGRELYGLHQARRANRKLDTLLVVEGYMDVVALAQFGITHAVATLGTAATSEHIERLFQACPRVVFCFDGDRAGRQAAWRALENALAHMRDGRAVGFVFLPDGEDPDTLVRTAGAAAFENAVRDASPLSDFLFDHLAAAVDLTTMEGRSKLYEEARKLLDRLPPGAFRQLAYGRLGELTRLSQDQLEGLMDTTTAPRRERHGPAARKPAAARGPSLTRAAITLLVHHPHLAASIPDARPYAELSMPGGALLHEILELLHHRPDLSVGGLIEHFRDHPEGRHLGRLHGETVPLLHAGLEDELAGALRRLLAAGREQRLRALTEKARDTGLTSTEKRELSTLLVGGPADAPGAAPEDDSTP